MIRKLILVLVGVAAFGPGAAFAQERDGDGNPVPGLSVQQPASGWEQAYAGVRPLNGVDVAQLAMAERLSRVH